MHRLSLFAATLAIGIAAPLSLANQVRADTGSPAPQSASSDPYSAQLNKALSDQALIDSAKAALTAEIAQAQGQQQALGALIVNNQTAIEQTLNELAVAEQTYHAATVREAGDRAAEALAHQHERDDRRLLSLYLREEYLHQDDLVNYLLSSDSFSDLLARHAEVSHLVHRSQDLVVQVQVDVADAQKNEAAATHDLATAKAAAATLADREQKLQDETNHAHDLIVQLKNQAAGAAAEIDAANTQSAALAQQIAADRIAQLDKTIAEAEAAAWAAAADYLRTHQPPMGSDGSQPLIWPVPGSTISQAYGPSPYDFEPSYLGYAHFHTGIDLAAAQGTPILAAASGIVVVARETPPTQPTEGYGNYVIIAHSTTLETLYGHMFHVLVKPGDTVTQGQMIGLVGSTGNSTGPHCHFEMRMGSSPADPTPLLPALAPGASGPPSA